MPMNRRFFFFGATALLASGCGGGGAPSLRYRYVALGNLYPLGLDDVGRAYLTHRYDQTTVYTANVDAGRTIAIPAESGGIALGSGIRPDGTLVTSRGFVPPGGVYRTVMLPTLAELNIPGEVTAQSGGYISDALPNGDYIGVSGMQNSLGNHTRSFVVRAGVVSTLNSTDQQLAYRLLRSGYVLLDGVPTIYSDYSRSLLFGPDNRLADHPINQDKKGIHVLDINDKLEFVGYRIGNTNLPDPTSEIVHGDRNSILKRPDLTGLLWLNARGDLLQSTIGQYYPQTPQNELRLHFNSGNSLSLLPFIPVSAQSFAIISLNNRREILGYLINEPGVNVVGEAFLLVPQ